MNRHLIAQVLREAADYHLWSGRSGIEDGREAFSCVAVSKAVRRYNGGNPRKAMSPVTVNRALKSLGVNPSSVGQFGEFEDIPERQAARFLWLDFAALVIEDGILES